MVDDSDLAGSFIRRVARAPAIDPLSLSLIPRLSPAILQRYEIKGELGEGGMGTVYAAFDRARGAHVALKMMSCFDAAALLRFKREFRTMAQLHHPNVVKLYDLLADGHNWCFTMELIDGEELGSHLGVEGTMEVLPQILDALEFLHGHGIIHRDLKPGNLLRARDGRLKVVDFGVIKELTTTSSTSAVVGTAGFMAPEQASAEAVTAAADLYALGCVLHYLLAGKPVFAGPQAKVLVDHRLATPPPLLERAPEVPEVLARIVDGLLAKDPSDRPTIAEVRNQLGLARLGPAPHR